MPGISSGSVQDHIPYLGSLFPLLRVAQLQAMMGLYPDAQASLDMAQTYVERDIRDIGRAGFWLVQAILSNLQGGEANFRKALEACEKVWKLGDQKMVSRQYLMAASCEASVAYLDWLNMLPRQAKIISPCIGGCQWSSGYLPQVWLRAGDRMHFRRNIISLQPCSGCE